MLHSIPEALAALKEGKIIIVVDDENRENEGDFLAAAENITPETINFMATHGRGLICVPLIQSRCQELALHPMVASNDSLHETAFTVSVDLKGREVSTGISAFDRAKTIQALINPQTNPEDLARPGHIFPLQAHPQGLKARPGHTEATIELTKLAGLYPAGVIVEIMNEDGTMARLPDLLNVSKKFNMPIISIKDLELYNMAIS